MASPVPLSCCPRGACQPTFGTGSLGLTSSGKRGRRGRQQRETTAMPLLLPRLPSPRRQQRSSSSSKQAAMAAAAARMSLARCRSRFTLRWSMCTRQRPRLWREWISKSPLGERASGHGCRLHSPCFSMLPTHTTSALSHITHSAPHRFRPPFLQPSVCRWPAHALHQPRQGLPRPARLHLVGGAGAGAEAGAEAGAGARAGAVIWPGRPAHTCCAPPRSCCWRWDVPD